MIMSLKQKKKKIKPRIKLNHNIYMLEINKHVRWIHKRDRSAWVRYRYFVDFRHYFGICKFFLRYYGIEYPPMSSSITSGKQRRPSFFFFFLNLIRYLKLNPLSKFPPFSERLFSEKTKLDRNSHTHAGRQGLTWYFSPTVIFRFWEAGAFK